MTNKRFAPDTITIFTVVIVKKHRNTDASEGNSWVCECRCCKVVRERMARIEAAP